WFTPGEKGVVLLSEGFWRERFGGRRDVVGQELQLGDGKRTIIGVLPRTAGLVQGLVDMETIKLWLPFEERPSMERGLHFLGVVGRLKPGVGIAAARRATGLMAARLQASGVPRHGITLQPGRDALVGDARPVFLVLVGGALFVLLIVCANLANLFL